MASQILAQGISSAHNIMAGEQNSKIAQLSAVTKNVHDKGHVLSADYGPKQSNTDDWLRVVTEDKTGPMLLEDQFAREKIHRFVHHRPIVNPADDPQIRPRAYS